MAYIGKKVEETELANRTVDTMTGDGSDTTMSLSATPISVNNVLVFFNGVMQRPTTDFTLSGSTITFAAAPFTGAVVVAITGEGGHIGRPSSPLPTEKFMDSAVTNAKLMSGIASSKLTGAMPALDGAALTGGGTPYTESASDPVVTTNPSTGVGTFWVNKSSGEVFCCTDATAGENVWINIGGGEGDIAKPFGGLGGGTTSGFTAGGAAPTQDTIEKFPFASNSGGVDHGNLAMARDAISGCSSATDGYVIGGYVNGPPGGVGGFRENIDRFSFASNTTAADHGNLTRATGGCVGCSSSTNGYAVSGHLGPSNIQSNIIDTFTFGSNSNATDHGDMSMAGRARSGGQSSNTHGYAAGGETPGPPSVTRVNIIDKFAFASNVTGTDHGDLSVTRSYTSGHSSITHGFTAGGYTGSLSDVIDKFSFVSNTTATDHANLSAARSQLSSQSSTTHGYCAAGSGTNTIDKFSFSNNTNAADHGDLDTAETNPSGHQV